MENDRVINEIIELNKNLSSIKSIEEISSKLKDIFGKYEGSVSSLDNSICCLVDDLSEENKKIEKLTNKVNSLASEKIKKNNFLKLEGILREINNSIEEHNIAIQCINDSLLHNRDEGIKSIEEIKLIINDIEKVFYPLISEVKSSTLKLSNFLKYSILDELGNLREDLNKLNAEKDKLLEEIKSIRNEINKEYLSEIQLESKTFSDVYTQIQAENKAMKKDMELIIQQNAALINFIETLKDKNEIYKEFINDMLNAWGKENIRWFAKK